MPEQNDTTKIDFYITPREAWDAMYEACASAKTSIDFEQYILKDDEEGLKFLRLFRDKARSGVQVRLILDRIGSRFIYASKIAGEIIEAGGRIHFYNKIGFLNLFAPNTWFPRNHMKLMLVDEKTAFVGSVCVAKEMAEWRDLHAKLEGPVVSDIHSYFGHIWKHNFRRWKKELTRKMGKNSNSRDAYSFVAALARFHKNYIYKELIDNIKTAKNRIYIVTPYFMPPFLLKHALFRAAARGVDVKIMMNLESDVPIADYVSQSYFPRFLRHGLKIFLYKTPVLHAKYVIIDDEWATLGSTNMDYLSLRRNREANIIVRQSGTVSRLDEIFSRDLENCMKADKAFCRNRGIKARVLGRIGRIFKGIL